MMTRKHFKATALEISKMTDVCQREEMARHYAKIFAASNPRFDFARFFAACNVFQN